MIIYLISIGFNLILTGIVSLVPVFETPAWIVTNLDSIFETIFGFNNYLPITETFTVVIFLLGFTLQYKIWKIILNKVGVNMNS